MSFQIKLGVTSSPRNKISKDIDWKYNLDGILKEECDILNPVITIRIGEHNGMYAPDIALCNYMYSDNFQRYYYMDPPKIIRNIYIQVSGHVDPLTTYKDQILENEALVFRSSHGYIHKLLDDGSVKIYNDDHIVAKRFTGAEFTSGSFVLAVAGSAATADS